MAGSLEGLFLMESTITLLKEKPSVHQEERLQALTLTYHSGVVIVGQHALTEGHQQPKGLFLWTVEQQDGGDDVHCLE